jgi:hypothetical protein
MTIPESAPVQAMDPGSVSGKSEPFTGRAWVRIHSGQLVGDRSFGSGCNLDCTPMNAGVTAENRLPCIPSRFESVPGARPTEPESGQTR